MNSQQLALFALVTLCLVSCALSQPAGSTSGGYLRFSGGASWKSLRTFAAVEGNTTVNITITSTLGVSDISNGGPVNVTALNSTINDTLYYIQYTGLPSFDPENISVAFSANNESYASNFTYLVTFRNNDTSAFDSNTSNIVNLAGTTNTSQQVHFFETLVTLFFENALINGTLKSGGINATVISTEGEAFVIVPPPPPSNTTSTITSTTTTTTTHSTGTTSTSLATSLSLSLSSWMSVASLVCLLAAYLL